MRSGADRAFDPGHRCPDDFRNVGQGRESSNATGHPQRPDHHGGRDRRARRCGGGYAHADSGAQGCATNSPGVLSGNTVQAPVDVPVNVCGNTVNVVGLLNPAIGQQVCQHVGGKRRRHGGAVTASHGGRHPGARRPGGTPATRRASAPATTCRRRSTCR